jgi:tripartite-type tricarboxylate transporter receptor subunit TctC
MPFEENIIVRKTQHTGAMRRFGRTAAVVAIASSFAIPATALAAAYPDKPVRMIVPSSPGGGTDTTMRIITPKLSEVLGQRVIIDNRPGQAGNIGLEVASRAAPDGYTLTAVIASNASNPALKKSLPFSLERDFVPISLASSMANVLIVHPSLPVKSVKELVALAKARPNQMQYASPGVGSTAHLAMELLLIMSATKMEHVPYKSGGAAFADVHAGHMTLMFGNIMNSLQHVKSGRVRALGVTSLKRSTGAPDIPTIAEAGLPGYEATTWYGVLAPAGTPRDTVAKLHDALVQTVRDPVVARRFHEGGAEATASTSPEEFAAFIRTEMKKWANVVKQAGIQPE